MVTDRHLVQERMRKKSGFLFLYPPQVLQQSAIDPEPSFLGFLWRNGDRQVPGAGAHAFRSMRMRARVQGWGLVFQGKGVVAHLTRNIELCVLVVM